MTGTRLLNCCTINSTRHNECKDHSRPKCKIETILFHQSMHRIMLSARLHKFIDTTVKWTKHAVYKTHDHNCSTVLLISVMHLLLKHLLKSASDSKWDINKPLDTVCDTWFCFVVQAILGSVGYTGVPAHISQSVYLNQRTTEHCRRLLPVAVKCLRSTEYALSTKNHKARTSMWFINIK